VDFLPDSGEESRCESGAFDDEAEPPDAFSGIRGESGLAAIKGEKTLSELAQQFDIHPNQITTWKSQLLEGAAGVFGQEKAEPKEAAVDLKGLHAKIGELTPEKDFCPARSQKRGC
jgi:hypothetical protein